MSEKKPEMSSFKMPESVNVTLIQEEDGSFYTDIDIKGKHTDNGALALMMMALAYMTKEYGFNKIDTTAQLTEVMSHDMF